MEKVELHIPRQLTVLTAEQVPSMQYQNDYEPNPATDFQPLPGEPLTTYEFNGATYALGCVAPYVFRYDTYVDEEGFLCYEWVLVGEADLVGNNEHMAIHDVYFYDNTEEYEIQMRMIEEEDEAYYAQFES